MKLSRIISMLFLGVSILIIIPCKAADSENVFPWKTGEIFTYRSDIEGEKNYAEQGILKKVKQKKGYNERSFEIEVITDKGTIKNTFNLDDKGKFLGSSGTIQSKLELSMVIRLTSTLKKNELTTTAQAQGDGMSGPRMSNKHGNVSDETWVLLDGMATLALRLSLEPLSADYDKIHPFFILNPFTPDRRSGKLRLQVTGEETTDFGGEKAPVYALVMTAPKQPFTMKVIDKDKVAQIKMWVLKADNKLVKMISSDLEIDMRLVP